MQKNDQGKRVKQCLFPLYTTMIDDDKNKDVEEMFNFRRAGTGRILIKGGGKWK